MMVTLSEHGVYIGNETTKNIIPAHVRNISDVSGAGDTVISVAALCLGLGLNEIMIASLANLAGGLVCEQVGVVPIDKELLMKEAEQVLA
jgi:bifunctional ADP-heptose synthase (sugar kinase/adenylyltransferase)